MEVTFNFGALFSGRSVIGDTLLELGQQTGKVYVVTADIGGALKNFREAFPDRYIDTGIAEQCTAGVAAGLALEGNIPIIMGMIPFMTMRACEQVRTDICYQNLPVIMIGTGGGLTSGGGSTHNAMEDIAIMKSLVNMSVVSLCDPNMIRDLIKLGVEMGTPLFIRLAQGKKDRMLYEPGTKKFEIGKGITLRDGKDITIIAHGEMVGQAYDAAEIVKEEGIDVRVVDMYSIKPFDKELVKQCIDETGHIIVLEDHLMEGGLASSIADWMLDEDIRAKSFKRMGIPPVYAGFGSGEELHDKYGYGLSATVDAIRAAVK